MDENHRGKIKKAPAPEVVKYLINPAIKTDLERSYQTILDINKAHVLMLAEEGIISTDVAKKILECTQEISAMEGHPTFEINPNVEDLYFNLEKYLLEQTGAEIGGQQHTARSRNDLFATEARMDIRGFYLRLCGMFNELRQNLINLGKANVDAVMSGYTHLQPSEPITFGHYCAGVLNALERDYERIQNAWKALNICPLGGGSMGSTTFMINRNRTSALLGFDEPMQNSIDCTASRDYCLEIIGTMSVASCTLSRFAYDLYMWSTPEYGYVEVDDSVAGCSSIMPQKKNALTLECCKGKAAHMEAFFVSVFSSLKNIPFTHCRDSSTEAMRFVWTALQEFEADLALLNVTIKTLTLKKERMLQAAVQNYCTVTELANYLVRHDGISFRSAHGVVAMLVGYMQEHNKLANEITVDDINPICELLLGKKTSLTDDLIREALDPTRNAMSKKTIGGSNSEEVTRQLNRLQTNLDRDNLTLESRVGQVKGAKEELERKVAEAIA